MARKTIESESFVLDANRLNLEGQRNRAMDLLYDRIDELMRTGQFQQLDAVFGSVPKEELSVDVLLGLLTATLPARSQLPSRPEFLSETKRILGSRGEFEEGLLSGLE